MSNQRILTKHPSVKLLSHKQIKTTIYIKSQTPFVSALKRVNKFLGRLQRHGAEYVSIMGMGKAVEKTLSIACHYQEEKGKKVEVITQSIAVLDEVVKNGDTTEEPEGIDDEDKETSLRKRTVTGVEIRIYP
ncbi:LADA_0D03444g1_1 [Lachancea dasiensis]|uniref:LADA_0D03444g1_1 n=1 Tax=Lachancea dasiensis TaxID=1072105 RepID=A0A1G4J584_9SACH|nr:LADA_0D03444g1_1 [Lachancea dasiensis]